MGASMACRVGVVTSKRGASAKDRGIKHLKNTNLNLLLFIASCLPRLPSAAAGATMSAPRSLPDRGCLGQERMDGRDNLRALTDRCRHTLDRP
jgi:hypothetical protein